MAENGAGLRGNWGWVLLTQDVASGSHGSGLAAAESESLQFPAGAFISLIKGGDVIEAPASWPGLQRLAGPLGKDYPGIISGTTESSESQERKNTPPLPLYFPQMPPTHAQHQGLLSKQDTSQSHPHFSRMNPLNSFSI